MSHDSVLHPFSILFERLSCHKVAIDLMFGLEFQFVCSNMDRACTMEVQQIAVELVETEEWSWIEISVVLGWLSWLIICCAFLRNLGIYVWALFPPRKPKSREMAGTREETRFTDASTQTVLCTPPSSLTQADTVKESRATTPEPIAVYSSYRRRAPREIDSRHGGKSLTGAGRHGSKARNGKEERGLERILGRGLGRGFNLGAMHDVKGKRGRMQRERDKEKEKPPKQEGLELDGNQAEVTGMKLACKLASSRRNIKCAVDKLKANFWAPSSKALREVKRGEVVRLARLLSGAGGQVFPLSQDVVEGVAACIKDANMKSGDQCLNELKLCHVECGHTSALDSAMPTKDSNVGNSYGSETDGKSCPR